MASRSNHGRSHGSSSWEDEPDSYEVVYCHACSHNWEREGTGLTCPNCLSDATEIITEANDPRDFRHDSSASTSPELSPIQYADSDPEEEDIDQHTGPHGFVLHRSVRTGGDLHHHNPDIGAVMNEFVNLIQNIGGPRLDAPRATPGQFHHHTTFTSNRLGGGSASVTIISASGPPAGHPPGAGGDPFQTIFSNALRDGPPQRTEGHDHVGPPPFAAMLNQLFGLLDPNGPNFGDAVYSQEAFDRIMTNFMETNPQTNAAPPATQDALDQLERKPVTKDLLGQDGKVDCPICIEDMKEGEMATFLPCKHWFHEDCVTFWLKEHNTCPICRSPIEERPAADARPQSESNLRRPSGESQGPSSPTASRPPHESRGSWSARPWASAFSSNFSPGHQTDGLPPIRPSMRSGQSRLNETMRNITSRQARQEGYQPDRFYNQGRPEYYDNYDYHDFSYRRSTPGAYDTSGFQRRTSHSPPSPPVVGSEEHSASLRQRSPSHGRRSGPRDSRRMSHGPLGWLRDRFSGGGSGRGNSRDER